MNAKVVVFGMMTRHPVGGVVWQTLHYLLGLQRLGVEVYYVEAHAQNPSMFNTADDDGVAGACAFLGRTLGAHGLGDRWTFHALHADGSRHGPADLTTLLREAACAINLHGCTDPALLTEARGPRVYLETDPVAVQLEVAQDRQETLAYLAAHDAWFTFGENYGRAPCTLPVAERFRFLPTRQPVVLDLWEQPPGAPAERYTTVGNWRQRWRDVVHEGETYRWSKHHEFAKVLDLPQRSGQAFELALSKCPAADRRALAAHGWSVVDALGFSYDRDRYRDYIRASRGELTVAKDQNVRFRTGWFSDRSATYLAAGRPVVTQDTGFGAVLPTGAGLFSFTDAAEAAAAVAAIEADYARHSAAASALARAFFAHDAVLKPLLAEVGL